MPRREVAVAMFARVSREKRPDTHGQATASGHLFRGGPRSARGRPAVGAMRSISIDATGRLLAEHHLEVSRGFRRQVCPTVE
jgi:hypothetical protein